MLYSENITNNAMEYEGLLAGLRAAIGLGIDKIIVKGDSQLVIKQVNKEYACPQMTIRRRGLEAAAAFLQLPGHVHSSERKHGRR